MTRKDDQISQVSSSPATGTPSAKTIPLLFHPPLLKKKSASSSPPGPAHRGGLALGRGAGAGASPAHSSSDPDSCESSEKLRLHTLLASLGVSEGVRPRRGGRGVDCWWSPSPSWPWSCVLLK